VARIEIELGAVGHRVQIERGEDSLHVRRQRPLFRCVVGDPPSSARAVDPREDVLEDGVLDLLERFVLRSGVAVTPVALHRASEDELRHRVVELHGVVAARLQMAARLLEQRVPFL
jgi:hypothetical protein